MQYGTSAIRIWRWVGRAYVCMLPRPSAVKHKRRWWRARNNIIIIIWRYTVWAKQISHVCPYRCTLAKKLRQAGGTAMCVVFEKAICRCNAGTAGTGRYIQLRLYIFINYYIMRAAYERKWPALGREITITSVVVETEKKTHLWPKKITIR